MKKCFRCREELPLTNFREDKMKYQLKCDKGRCKVCIKCDYERASEGLSIVRFNFETKKFESIEFENIQELDLYFKKFEYL